MDLLTTPVVDEIQRRIDLHHNLYESIKIDSTFWEYILYKSLLHGGFTPEWSVGSHAVGTDIICNNVNISLKGGVIKNNKDKIPYLTISSHRTTQYKTLDDKLGYLSKPHEDVIYSLAKQDEGYTLTTFKPVNPKEFVWEVRDAGWRGKDVYGNQLDIIKKMSDQYWMKLNYNWLQKTTYAFKISKRTTLNKKSK